MGSETFRIICGPKLNELPLLTHLATARRARGYSQQRLAAKLGISQGVLQYIELGKHRGNRPDLADPRLMLLARYADVLGLELRADVTIARKPR